MKNKLIIWAYVAEHLASVLIVLLISLIFSFSNVSSVFAEIATKLAILTGTLLAGSIAFYTAFFTQISTPFGQYLAWKNAAQPYSKAFATSVIYHIVATVSLIAISVVRDSYLDIISLYLTTLSLINGVIMATNIKNLVTLKIEFEKNDIR